MLILTRKIGEAIMIGDNVSMVVLDVTDGPKVKLGIRAPKEVEIYRQEVYNPGRKRHPLTERDVEKETENFYNS